MLGTAGAHFFGQGMSTRKAPVQPRGRASGIAFAAHFTDVAPQAGLTSPTVYGAGERNQYILETTTMGGSTFSYWEELV